MSDDSFKIVARLDIPKSVKLIKEDIPKIEGQLKSNQVKITAGLDVTKSKNLIQSQLATITNQVNAPTIKVGIDVGNVQQSINTVTDKVKTDGRIKFAPVVDVNTFMKNIKSALGTEGSEIKKAYQEYLQQLTLNPNDKQAILSSYENLKDSIQNAMQIVPQSDNSWKTFETIVKNCTTYISDLGSKSSEATNGIKAIDNAITDLNKLSNNIVFKNNISNPQVSKTKAEIASLIDEYQNLKTKFQGNVTPEGLEQFEAELTQLNSRFKTATEGAENLQRSLADTNGIDKQRQKIDTLIARIEAYKKANPKAMKQYGSQTESMLSELKGGNLDKIGVDEISRQFQILRLEIQKTGKTGKGFFEKLSDQAKKFSSWMTLTGVITSAWHGVKQMVDNVIELDSAMTNLKKVTDETETTYARFLNNAFKKAQNLHSKVSDLIEQTSTWAKLGYSLQDAESLAKISMIYSKVGEVDNERSVSDLVTVMKANFAFVYRNMHIKNI